MGSPDKPETPAERERTDAVTAGEKERTEVVAAGEQERTDAVAVGEQNRTDSMATERDRSDAALEQSRQETRDAGLNTETVMKMVEELASGSQAIQDQYQEFQASWVENVAQENIIFKQRNKVLVFWARVVGAAATIVLVGVIILGIITYSTNQGVNEQVKDKDAQIDTLQTQVEGYEYILTQQALPAITYMQDRLKSHGEDVRVVLQLGQPPFTPPTTAPAEEE